MKKLDLISGSSTSSKGELAWQLLRALSGLRGNKHAWEGGQERVFI